MSPEFLGAGLLIAIVGVFLWVGPVYFAMLLAATVVLATAYYKLLPYVSDLSYSAFWEHLQPGDTIKLAVCAAVLTACCAMSDGSAEFQAVTACVNAAITGR